MAQRLEILCYGHDQTLLDTRRMILQSSFRVETASSLAELAHLGGVMDVALIVICHTVPEEECRRVMQISGALWPKSGVLSVQALSDHGYSRSCLPSHYQVDSTPQHLKDRICLLLAQEAALSERKLA
ncbi:MAG: hypothetical protein JSS87_10775 [Acidobacteria bacterium]|nr:hypothetical protein [Acidobacteriota bacterium]